MWALLGSVVCGFSVAVALPLSHLRATATATASAQAPAIPESLRGRNLVIAGDSNDRYALFLLCDMYGAKVSVIQKSPAVTRSVQQSSNEDSESMLFYTKKMNSLDQKYLRAPRYCHITEHNMTVILFNHFGVMSVEPQPQWHADSLQVKLSKFLPVFSNGSVVHSSVDLASRWWPRTMADSIPKRPVVLLAQSSLWDSVMAMEYMDRRKLPTTLSLSSSAPDVRKFSSWHWTEHAGSWLESLRNSGIKPERIYWRTNPNCPQDGNGFPIINQVSEAQAQEARRAISEGKGPWAGVKLIDWRAEYKVTKPSDCFPHAFNLGGSSQVSGLGGLKNYVSNSIHYRNPGYTKLWETVWRDMA